jgi:signal transduction histidine kinase
VVTGWTVIGCGLVAWWRIRGSRCGPLLVASGLTWFVTDLSACLNIEPLTHRCLDIEPLGAAAEALGWLWLGIFGHAVVTFPSGRLGGRTEGVAVAVGYAAALLMNLDSTLGSVGIAAVVGVVPALRWAQADPVERPDRAPGIAAGLLLAAALAADLAGLLPVYGFELAVALAAILLLAGLLAVDTRRRRMTVDTAVELGDALAEALDDPSLRVVFREQGGWPGAGGPPTPPPGSAQGVEVTTIERDGDVIAVITHDPASLRDDEVRDAVVRAVELAAHHVRLQRDLEAQVSAVEASRRRLVDSALRERRDLGARVDQQVERRLDEIAVELAGALSVRGATQRLATARQDIADLSQGLYPRELGEVGLEGALRELAARSTLPVELDVAEGASASGDAVVDASIYFFCAEALTNAARHAPAASVRVTLSRSDGAITGAITVTISDDGPGGADATRGSGLRGLRDRVAAIGGTMRIDSPAGAGTRLEATFPVSPEARVSSRGSGSGHSTLVHGPPKSA